MNSLPVSTPCLNSRLTAIVGLRASGILSSKVSVFAELHRKSRECAPANRALLAEVIERPRADEQLRALTHRVVQMQEAERGSVALDLHDNITQALCGILLHSRALAQRLAGGEGALRLEAIKLGEMLGPAAAAVERISQSLRPIISEHVGLAAVLGAIGDGVGGADGRSCPSDVRDINPAAAPAHRDGAFPHPPGCLGQRGAARPAHRDVLSLTQRGGGVQLTIQDDGVGFDLETYLGPANGQGGLGVLGMRERSASVGGDVKIKSICMAGTEIEVRMPLPPTAEVAD